MGVQIPNDICYELHQICQIKYRYLYLFEDISKRIADICNKLQISVVNCRYMYLQMWITCETVCHK